MDIRNLTFKYPKGTKYVLDDVSFTLKKEKINAIVGVNGSGKTTLFDCITRVLTPQSGDINLPNINEILYLTQTIYFSPVIKGKDFAKFILRLDNRPANKDVQYFLEPLTDREKELFIHLWDLKLGKMSLGERKWLFITLLSQIINRSIYIFDEPTSGVDPSSRRKIFTKISALIRNGKTCIMSTHQLQDLMNLECHLIMLHQGSIVYEGDFQEWLQKYDTSNPDEAFEIMLDSTERSNYQQPS
ncbi:AAA family ATPase [Bacillus chungangensis]|uniref:ABC-2 type transport system ATP-binding protein n=1 Tax=Bacillus chungangensis TaxID=587633 RepID=A0ABT9WTH5_9BACI|nr:ABC transporter ATP-binding protein [Bacillus chungangensis]MDQ0176603.1 ABC-2 type transport system ATP-binding protein [Bacillus chungangensis]